MSEGDAPTQASQSGMPRWRQLVNRLVDDSLVTYDDDSLFYSLATVAPNGAPSVRMVGHRGFVNERIVEEKTSYDTSLTASSSSAAAAPNGSENSSTKGRRIAKARRERVNDGFATTDALWITTDVRSEKGKALLSATNDDEYSKRRGAIVWWFSKAGMQVRLSGSLHLIAHESSPSTPGLASPQRESSSANKEESFDWQGFRMQAWLNLEPDLVDALKRPAPGSLHPKATMLEGRWPGDNGDDGDGSLISKKSAPCGVRTEDAFANFAIIVLQPDTVDIWERKYDRRSACHLKNDGNWTEERIVP